MAFPSEVQGTGQSGAAAVAICGNVGNTLTAAGTDAATALQLSAVINRVSTTAASTGVKLQTSQTSAFVLVANDGASTLTVYPQTGTTIDGNASVTIATTKRCGFYGISPTAWVSVLGA